MSCVLAIEILPDVAEKHRKSIEICTQVALACLMANRGAVRGFVRIYLEAALQCLQQVFYSHIMRMILSNFEREDFTTTDIIE